MTYPFIFDIQAKWCIDVGLQSVVQVVEANVKFGPAAIAREIVDSGGRSLSAICGALILRSSVLIDDVIPYRVEFFGTGFTWCLC